MGATIRAKQPGRDHCQAVRLVLGEIYQLVRVDISQPHAQDSRPFTGELTAHAAFELPINTINDPIGPFTLNHHYDRAATRNVVSHRIQIFSKAERLDQKRRQIRLGHGGLLTKRALCQIERADPNLAVGLCGLDGHAADQCVADGRVRIGSKAPHVSLQVFRNGYVDEKTTPYLRQLPDRRQQVPGELTKSASMDTPSYVTRDAFAVNLDLQPRFRGKQIEPFTAFKIGELNVEAVLHQVCRYAKLDLNGH